jgi:TRAP-type C4-dicarboxylate transport system substrate-binding protein
MKSVQLSPVALPLTDVLTGLQTGLVDIVAIPPVVALALQRHTKVKYVTQTPVLYVMGFLAIKKSVFERLSEEDQAIVDEVMTRIYANIDAGSEKENKAATRALINVGLKDVEPLPGEFEALREQMIETNRAMAQQGLFSMDILQQLQGYIAEYRAASDGTDANDGAVAAESQSGTQ